ncbi:immunoglobulin domain-containing protein [Horticoccus luteus]|uniref:Immunoglobulin domain-containing protein n=1 Tax=Horticoccus luteus TaxID=2862869 RepID=A0A8F9XK63_9BACT|nr:immunoglobulin domain-containing protein [Horticoccus luteus]QYM77876.1 immunoglobulin domain-containing protein [Horticoccus luteus]
MKPSRLAALIVSVCVALCAAAQLARAQPYVVGQKYYDDFATKYIEYIPGDLPIVITAPHGGSLTPFAIPDRANGTYTIDGVSYTFAANTSNEIVTATDLNTEDLATKVVNEILARTGHRPHLIICHLKRSKLDANREKTAAALGNPIAGAAWDAYQAFILAARATVTRDFGFSFHVDLHGHGHTNQRLELGYNLSSSDLGVSDAALNRAGVLYDTSVRTLPLNRPDVTLATVLRGSRSIGDFMSTLGFPACPSPQDPQPKDSSFFQGGYTTRTHTCWTDNGIDHGLQIECNSDARTDANRPLFAAALAQALNAVLFDNYGYSLGAAPIYRLSAPTTTLTAGGPSVTVTLQRSGYAASADTVALSFGGNALRGTDYTASATTVSFSSGETSRTITLTPLTVGGSADKTITVQLAPVVPQTADTTPLTFALASGSLPIVRVTADAATVSESAGSAIFRFTRTTSVGPLTVNVAWSGDATVGRHYLEPIGSSFTFADGQSEFALTVPLIDDGRPDPARQLTLSVTSGTGYVLGTRPSATVQITDDDHPAGLALWLARGLDGNRLPDDSGQGRDGAGVPGNAPTPTTWTTGNASGSGLAFNGAYQAALVPRFTVDPQNAFTLSFRFRTSAYSTNQYLVSYGPRDSAGSLTVYMTSATTLRTSLNNSAGTLNAADLDTAIPNLTNNTWRLYTLTVDPTGGRRVYIDGVLQKSAGGWSGSLSPTELFWLGWRAQATTSSANYFTGSLADVRVYQRALSAAEVTSLSSGTSTFATWLAEQGLPANEHVYDDDDADGWGAALEYALGTNPLAAASAPVITATRGDGTVQFDFTRRTDTTDVALALEYATSSSGPWFGVASLAAGASTWNADPDVVATDAAGAVSLLVNDETTPRLWRLRAAIGVNTTATEITPSVAPVFTTQPVAQSAITGTTVTLSVAATGLPAPVYQWAKDGVALPGETSPTLTLANAQPSASGAYTVVASNSAGSATSTLAQVVIGDAPVILAAPTSESVVAGTHVALSVTAFGADPLTYQWRKNDVDLPGATAATLAFTPVQMSDAGNYSVVVTNPLGSTSSSAATLTVVATAIAPTITAPPQSQTLYTGQTLALSVTPAGTSPFTYQWAKDNAPLTGATAATFNVASAAVTDAGNYTVTITNDAGSITSAPASVAVTTATAPAITTQPVAQSVIAGATVTFSVAASGNPAPAYQWSRNSTPLAGATSATLVLTNVTSADAGLYSVVVTNPGGSVGSLAVNLTVLTPPTIATQPQSRASVEGSEVTFTVAVSGSGPFTYQWRRNGVALSGATSASLTLTNLASTDAGTYNVVVTGAGGTVPSADATLTVAPPSYLSNLSVRAAMDEGQTLIVGFVVSGTAKPILVRAAGPALDTFGLAGVADPHLALYQGTNLVAGNDDWDDSLATVFTHLGAFPFTSGSKDAALLQTLTGVYTAQASGTGNGSVLVEAYDAQAGSAARFTNLSARFHVGTGSDILIAGFAVGGGGYKAVLIRAVGPALAAFGVPGTLADPKLSIYDQNGNFIVGNDNWSGTLVPIFKRLGAFPLYDGSADAAILVSLEAGKSYTVQVVGADGGTGEALVEIYDNNP